MKKLKAKDTWKLKTRTYSFLGNNLFDDWVLHLAEMYSYSKQNLLPLQIRQVMSRQRNKEKHMSQNLNTHIGHKLILE